MVIIFKARHGTIKVEDDITIDALGNLEADFVTSTVEANVKNITITTPDLTIDKIDCIGESTAVVGSEVFQNQYIDEKSTGMATCTGTVILDGDENNWWLEATGATAIAVASNTYSRYQVGSSTSGKTRTGTSAILLHLDDAESSPARCNIVFNSGKFTKIGDVKTTGADGHWEYDFEFKCKTGDFYIEYLD